MPSHKKLLAALCLTSIAAPAPSFAQNAADAPELAAIIVTATRQETRASEVLADVSVIEREEIERSGQETITDLLARQPGVQTVQSGGAGTAASIFLRGANYNQTKVLIDGVELNTLDGSPSILRFLPLADVERIEILRGPASSLYGANTIGGVIQIFTRRGKPGLHADAFAGYGTHDTRQAAAGVSGGNEQWRFRVDANHYETNGISARKDGVNKDKDKDAYRNTGGGVSLSFLPAAGHEIGLNYRQNRGVAHYDGGPSYPNLSPSDQNYDYREYFEIQHWRLFSRNRILSAWESEISYGEAEDERKDYNTWNQPSGSITRAKTKNRQWVWQNNVDLPLGRALFAVERLKQTTEPRTDPGAFNPLIYDHTPEIHNTSALAGWTAHHGDHRWQINIRRDRHSEFGGKTTYGASYGYQLTETLRAHVGYGTAFRAPSIVDLYRPGWGGNPDLKPEEAKNTEAGLTWERGAHQTSVTYYHNRIKNMIAYLCGASNCQNENVDKALLEGVTLAYQGAFGAWRMNASYDWLNARNESHAPQDGMGYERLARRARDRAAVSLAYIRGKSETGIELIGVGRRYDLNYRKDAADKEQLGGYTLVNLTASYAIRPDLHLEGRLNNIFDKKYETVRYYDTSGFNAFIGLRYSPE